MKVSVLIPAYNVEKYISQCLESVCNQTHRDLQIVVIDDGSKDSTSSILSAIAEKDNRIEIISRENRGVAQTRNELLDRANGDFVLFVDSDDWIEPDMISTLIGISENNSADLAMCRNVSNELNLKNKNCEIRIWDRDEILNKFLEHRELTGSLCNKLIRRNLFEGVRFNPGIGYGEDALVMWDIINKIDKLAYTQSEFYHYRMNDASISHQGFSAAKMSVVPVWEHISRSLPAQENGLESAARARYGAEVVMLLMQVARQDLTNEDKERIKILREKLKEMIGDVYQSRKISAKFKIFSIAVLACWPLVSRVMKVITR